MKIVPLKPCPFCGGNVKTVRGPLGVTMISCRSCGACVSFFGKEDKTCAAAAWNNRKEDENA